MIEPAKTNTHQMESFAPGFARRVFGKSLVLLLLFNFVFALAYPLDELGSLSTYNKILPGRQRLPYGENPTKAYNLSLYNLPAMFASHEIAGQTKSSEEYRVIFIGDSSTWGFLLPPSQTVPSIINQADQRLADGRRIRSYNLGYPVMSVTKDLLILSEVMRYQPDLIVWPVTLESFPLDKQLFPPLLQNNAEKVKNLIHQHGLNLNPDSPELIQPGFWQRTILGSRRDLADLVWLQLFGVMWAATGIDQDIPEAYTPRMEDLPDEQVFHGLTPPDLQSSALAFDVLQAGKKIAGDIPILLVNEPMYISQGKNSDIRYNFYYPRWAYDDYRPLLQTFCSSQGIDYLDLWDAIPAQEFTNSAVHLTLNGNQQYAQILLKQISEIAQSPVSQR